MRFEELPVGTVFFRDTGKVNFYAIKLNNEKSGENAQITELEDEQFVDIVSRLSLVCIGPDVDVLAIGKEGERRLAQGRP